MASPATPFQSMCSHQNVPHASRILETFIKTASRPTWLLGLLAGLWMHCYAHGDEPTLPNIVLIHADDVGRECLGCYGGRSYATPHLDKLAADGCRFHVCYATPMCSPSRFALHSGKYSFRNYAQWGEFDFEQPTIAKCLQAAGYRTAMSGKWHMGGWESSPYGPHRAGFDSYTTFDYEKVVAGMTGSPGNAYWNTEIQCDGKSFMLGDRYSPTYFHEQAISFMRSKSESKRPFFLYYPVVLAHRPFVPTDSQSSIGKEFRGKLGELQYFPHMIERLDSLVGSLRANLEELGLTKNTVVIFTADNGTDNVSEAKELRSLWNDQNIAGGKYLPTDWGVNVPLLVAWPAKFPAGRLIKQAVAFVDILPTLCDLAHIESPSGIDGQSLVRILKDESDTRHSGQVYSWGFFEHTSRRYKNPIPHRQEILHVVRDERWKLYSDDRLFDMDADPNEEHPLAPSEHLEVRARLKAFLAALRAHPPVLW